MRTRRAATIAGTIIVPQFLVGLAFNSLWISRDWSPLFAAPIVLAPIFLAAVVFRRFHREHSADEAPAPPTALRVKLSLNRESDWGRTVSPGERLGFFIGQRGPGGHPVPTAGQLTAFALDQSQLLPGESCEALLQPAEARQWAQVEVGMRFPMVDGPRELGEIKVLDLFRAAVGGPA